MIIFLTLCVIVSAVQAVISPHFFSADKRSYIIVKDTNVKQDVLLRVSWILSVSLKNNEKSNWRPEVQLNHVFVLVGGGGAGRYFKVSSESEAVLGDSKWFE